MALQPAGPTRARNKPGKIDVQIYAGFYETSARLLFPYSDRLVHLSEEQPPVHMTILANGVVENVPKPLYLGGTWSHEELERMELQELLDISTKHGTSDRSSGDLDRAELVDRLVGKERDPNLKDRALTTFPVPQTMSASSAAKHLAISPNNNFVWPREDGTVTVVHCWPVKYNEVLRSSFD